MRHHTPSTARKTEAAPAGPLGSAAQRDGALRPAATPAGHPALSTCGTGSSGHAGAWQQQCLGGREHGRAGPGQARQGPCRGEAAAPVPPRRCPGVSAEPGPGGGGGGGSATCASSRPLGGRVPAGSLPGPPRPVPRSTAQGRPGARTLESSWKV